ncbi:hypothetical protein ABIA31_006326 [Catenulispora sp. MAP5-51]
MTDGAKLSLPTARTLLEMPNLSTTTIFGGPEALTPSVQQSIDTALADIPQIQTLRDFQTQAIGVTQSSTGGTRPPYLRALVLLNSREYLRAVCA